MKVDYNQLAKTYDSHRGGGGPYLDLVVSLARDSQARSVLEIGAGTGNNTAAFARQYPCSLTALERSSGMLAKGVEKGIAAHWLQGCAMAIPLADASVDFVFGCYVLHYIEPLAASFAECARILRRGAAAFVTAPIDFIERHPMNAYFPSFTAIDKARFQSLDAIRQAFESAGFRGVDSKRFVAEPRPIDSAHVERIANKFTSTYVLLPEDEFEAGLAHLRADIKAKGQLDKPLVWESLVVWAYV